MSKYLLKEVKTFRTDSELEAAALVDMYVTVNSTAPSKKPSSPVY